MGRLKILVVASECAPYAKTGGLGDVVGALPAAMAARGHDVRVVLPAYRGTKSFESRPLPHPLCVNTGAGEYWCGARQLLAPNAVPTYLIERDDLFDRDGLYGDQSGAFADNLLRFLVLSRASLDLAGALRFVPDVIHVHDWQTALIATLPWHQYATVLTIHNLGYQGVFELDQLNVLNLSVPEAQDCGLEHFGAINILKAGILGASQVTTVSPTYADEIQRSEHGAGLDGVLRMRRSHLVGILNGIDENEWDPSTDRFLRHHFSRDALAGKTRQKAALQRDMGLSEDVEAPLFGVVSRLAHQKGIDIFCDVLPALLATRTSCGKRCQVVVLGSGDVGLETRLRDLAGHHDNLAVQLSFDEGLAHRIEAGADFFVMPSRYEPCGLNQMYSQRYGTLPIVRSVGGLRDTVDPGATGFTFSDLDAPSLFAVLLQALDVYAQPTKFVEMRRAAMAQDFSWDAAAASTEAAYRLAIHRHRRRKHGG